jgi:hypothetical protein
MVRNRTVPAASVVLEAAQEGLACVRCAPVANRRIIAGRVAMPDVDLRAGQWRANRRADPGDAEGKA